MRGAGIMIGVALLLAACQPYKPTFAADPAPPANPLLPAVPTAALAPVWADAATPAPVPGVGLPAGGGGGGGTSTQPGSATAAADGLVAGFGPAPDGRDPVATLGGGDLGGLGGTGTGVRGDDGSQVTPVASPTPR